MNGNKHNVVATLYDRKGNVLARAQNNYRRSHPIQATFAKIGGMPERIYLHAEIAALIKLPKNVKPYRIHVERYTRDDRPALAKPCPVCEAALKHWGCKVVSYTL